MKQVAQARLAAVGAAAGAAMVLLMMATGVSCWGCARSRSRCPAGSLPR